MADEFSASTQRLFALYNDGEYAGALDVARDLAFAFPEQGEQTSFWQICLLARLGETEGAVQVLETAVNAGLWWSAAMLREEEDLTPLQDLPAFNKLVQICHQRFTAAQAAVKPELLTLLPEGDPPPLYPLLVVLHGRRSTATKARTHWEPATGLGWLLALPQSSQVAGQGKYSWDDLETACEEIKTHLARLQETYPLDPEKTVLAGFSQGGALAIELSLATGLNAAGFFAVVPGMRQVERLKGAIQSSKVTGLRGYFIAGEQDPRFGDLIDVLRILGKHKIACELEKHTNLGHDYPEAFASSLAAGLRYVTNRES